MAPAPAVMAKVKISGHQRRRAWRMKETRVVADGPLKPVSDWAVNSLSLSQHLRARVVA
jgi:hypothetical protein